MRRLVLLALAVGLLSAAPAVAVPYNNTQVGSLLVFADVRFDANYTTIIRIANTHDSLPVSVLCYWMNRNKERSALQFELTRNQPIVFDPAIFFTDSTFFRGELKCFAVNTVGNQVNHNHLIGTATVIDYDTGAAYEYTAAAFGVRGNGVGDPGTLLLNNTNYDQCYQYLYGQITQEGRQLPVGDAASAAGAAATVLGNRLAIASCIQDLRQDFRIKTTKLIYEIWNAAETKFGSGQTIWDCADSWHETILGDPGYWKSQNLNTFVNPLILASGTDHLVYRVSTVVSSQCTGTFPGWLPGGGPDQVAPGLIAIQSTLLDVTDAQGNTCVQAVGTNLNGKGTRNNGVILFDAAQTPSEP